MDILHFIAVKKSHAEQNAEDQRHLSRPESASYWQGKASAWKEIDDALRHGIVKSEGIERITTEDLEGKAS